MTIDTKAERARIEALLDGVTPGTWEFLGGTGVMATGSVDTYSGSVLGRIVTVEHTIQRDVEGREWCAGGNKEANARLIASAPDLAANTLRLLDEIERLLVKRDAAWKAGAEAMLRELSGNTGELRDAVAAAIRADGSDLCDGPWETLPEANRLGWRGDAERAIVAVKDYLTAQVETRTDLAEGGEDG